MDTATASLENKPLKETEGPLDDSSPGPGCYQLAAVIQTKEFDSYQQISCPEHLLEHFLAMLAFCITCIMNSSSFSTNESNAFATSALNLNKNKQWSVQRLFYFPRKNIFI